MKFEGFNREKLVVSKREGVGHDHLLIRWEDGTHWYLHIGLGKSVTIYSGDPDGLEERPALKASPSGRDMIDIRLE